MNTLTYTIEMGGESETLTLSAPTLAERRNLVSELRKAAEPPPALPDELKELGMSIKDALGVKEFKEQWDAWEQRNQAATIGTLGVSLAGIAAIKGQTDKSIPTATRDREFLLWRDLSRFATPGDVGNWLFQQLSLSYPDGAERFQAAVQWAMIASSGIDPQAVNTEIESFRGDGERDARAGSLPARKSKAGRTKTGG